MDNQKERVGQQRNKKSNKETKSGDAGSKIWIEFLEEMTDDGNVNIASVWETLDMQPRKLVKVNLSTYDFSL